MDWREKLKQWISHSLTGKCSLIWKWPCPGASRAVGKTLKKRDKKRTAGRNVYRIDSLRVLPDHIASIYWESKTGHRKTSRKPDQFQDQVRSLKQWRAAAGGGRWQAPPLISSRRRIPNMGKVQRRKIQRYATRNLWLGSSGSMW